MLYKLIIKPPAEMDVIEAVEWYEGQSQGLGEKFLLAYEEVESWLNRNPYMFAKILFQLRKALLQKFPYAVFYQIDENEKIVRVIAVLHSGRNPEIIDKRISLL